MKKQTKRLMEIQDPLFESKPKPESNQNAASSSCTSENVAGPSSPSSTSTFIRNGSSHHHHRRAHTEVNFLFPEDMTTTTTTLIMTTDPIGGGSSTASLDEIGSEDDLFSTYIDVDKFTREGDSGNGRGNGDDHTALTSFKGRPNKHRQSNSIDGFGEITEAKKAMPPEKLAELWNIDPKRAKRILANRLSAARSKERKARYILELERKVQTLQTESTTLSAQLTLFQRDTTGLSTENTELKLRLQAMEQQAQLSDALNEALKKEVERLKFLTGEMMDASDSFNLGLHAIPLPLPLPYNPSNLFEVHHKPGPPPPGHQNLHLPPISHYESSRGIMHHPQQRNSQLISSDNLQNDQLGRLQGLEISNKGQIFVKSEVPSLSGSESSTTF